MSERFDQIAAVVLPCSFFIGEIAFGIRKASHLLLESQMTMFSRPLTSLVLLTSSLVAQSAPVSLSLQPAHPLIEHRDAEQRLNFDFALPTTARNRFA
jgi:hypothetical protein